MARYFGVALRNGLPIGLGSSLALRGASTPPPPPPPTPDDYFEYTTLLLPGNGTNGAQNNTFLDSSTNNFTITRNGNTTQGSFSPFSQTGWSNYFDGTGDDLTTPSNAAFTYGTGDFCVEGWFYFTGGVGGSGYSYAFAQGASTGSSSLGLYIQSGVYKVWNGSAVITGTASFVQNTWVHLAVTRSGTTMRLFVNGVQDGSATNSSNITTGTTTGISIGRWSEIGDTNYITGYVSSFRVVKGAAVYTSAFTVPTTPLTAITNTSLLTCQSNRFIDNSSNAFAITRNGDVSVQAFSPFNPTASWSAATNGGSGYFDGSGDYLSIANNSAFALNAPSGNTNDFTVEFWAYPTTTGITEPIGTTYSGSNYWAFAFNRDTGGGNTVGNVQFYMTDSFALTGAGLVASQWNHIAAVRTSTTVSLFVNGSRVATSTSSVNPAPTGALQMGKDTVLNRDYTGYIASARIVTGSTQPYSASSSSITVPTSPSTAITGTQVLYSLTNAGIYDATSKNDLETVGNAQISTTQSKFGGSSMYFDGTGDWLTIPDSPGLRIGTGDFTIEGWFYTTTTSGVRSIFYKSQSDTNGVVFVINNLSAGAANLYAGTGSGSWSLLLDAPNAITVNTWTHLAAVRYGNVWMIFSNGNLLASATNSVSATNTTEPATVGYFRSANPFEWSGYIQDFRITKGIARYTAAFTPPTTAFPLL